MLPIKLRTNTIMPPVITFLFPENASGCVQAKAQIAKVISFLGDTFNLVTKIE